MRLVAFTLLFILSLHTSVAAVAPTTVTRSASIGGGIASKANSPTHGRNFASTCTNCSGRGTCTPSGVCQCDAGAFGVDCSIGASAGSPVYSFVIHGGEGQVITQEWFNALNATTTEPYLHLRWCTTEDSWFGGIFNVAPDGMSPKSGSNADTWTFWVAPTGTVYVADWASTSPAKPDLDAQQDLIVVNGWRNATHQCAEFRRLYNTGDANDIVLSTIPGDLVRFMWTHGDESPSESRVERSKNGNVRTPQIPMHKYLGYTGQFKVDFAAGTYEPLLSGVRWPYGYWFVLLLSLVCLLLPFGLILQRDSVKVSRVGWWLRKRPMKLCCGGRRTTQGEWYHRYTLQFLPTLRNLSYQEVVATLFYLGINLATVFASLNDYDDAGRSATYIFGHLLALHLALALLPVSRNSFFLALCNIGIDHAITWHRRINNMTIFWCLAHFVSMIIFWDPAIVVATYDCQFGMGPLYGTLSMLCLLGMFFTSVEWVRRNHYKIFLLAHINLATIGYVFALMHSYNMRWLLLGPGVIWLVDFIVRTVYNPYVKFGGKIVTNPSAQATGNGAPAVDSTGVAKNHKARLVRIETCASHAPSILHSQVAILTILIESRKPLQVPKPGSHVYLVVPEISHIDPHPYTISNARVHTDQETYQLFLTIHVLAMKTAAGRKELERSPGDQTKPSWSQRLFNLASQSSGGASHYVATYDGWDGDATLASSKPAPFSLLLDGPYYSLNLPVLHYPVLVLVGGGIGVTPLMSLLSYYMECYAQRRAAALVDGAYALNKDGVPYQPLPRLIHVIWSSRDASPFKYWFPQQMEMLKQHAARIKVQLFVTAPTDVPLDLIEHQGAGALYTPNDKGPIQVVVSERKEEETNAAVVESHEANGANGDAANGNGHSDAATAFAPAVSAPNPAANGDLTEVELTQPASSQTPTVEHVRVHIPPPLDHVAGQIVKQSDTGEMSPAPMPVQHGRPNFTAFFESLRENLHTFDGTLSLRDVLVLSCGPDGMIEDVELEAERHGCSFTHEAFSY